MKHLPLIVLFLIILTGSIAYFSNKKSSTPPPPLGTQNQTTSTPSATSESFIPASTDTSVLKQGGSSFRESQGLYTFLYPNDYKLDTQGDEYIRISKIGATQRGQTEMYDGVIVVFESVNLGGKTLDPWIDARIAQSTADGTSQVTQAKKATRLNTLVGYTYTMRGLGESTYLVVQKDTKSNNAVSITFLVADPENKNYQKEVDAILATLELLK
jgi:hypothetical protein